MKKALLAGAVAALLLLFPALGIAATWVDAGAAALICEDTGQVLFAQNENEELPMASTTKVMTALLAIEYGHLQELVTCTEASYGTPGTSIYLDLGEKRTLEELLYGLMLASGNDAAMAIAVHIGGTAEAFADMMNQRASQLGLTHTVFATPHGLPADNHHTTALELAMLAREAMRYPLFRILVSTQHASIPWEGRSYHRVLNNKNRLLSTYEGATGIKTGYTRAAGRCLVFSAERNGLSLIGTVLACPDWFDQAEKLLDYGFDTYEFADMVTKGETIRTLPVIGGEKNSVAAIAAQSLGCAVKKGEWPDVLLTLPMEINESVSAGDVLGTISLLIDGEVVATCNAVAAENVYQVNMETELERIRNNFLLVK